MKVVKKVPEKGKPGRPATMYYRLFLEIKRTHGPGVTVMIRTYMNPNSAHEAMRRIQKGEVKVPGGARAWEMHARRTSELTPKVGSMLYVRLK